MIANSVNLLSKTEYDIAGLFNNTSNQNQNDQLIIIEYKPEEINRVEVAGLIQNLADANVRSILLDLDLSNPSLNSMDDEILANALEENTKVNIFLPIYSKQNKFIRPLSPFSKHTKLGYINLQADNNDLYTPIQLKLNTAADSYPHSVLLQVGGISSDNNTTLIQPGIDINSIVRLPFSQSTIKIDNQHFKHKDVIIGPTNKRTKYPALLFSTLQHGNIGTISAYIILAIFLTLSLLLVNLFSKNENRSQIIFISICIAVSPLILNLISIVYFRILFPAFLLGISLISVILYLVYHHRSKFIFTLHSFKIGSSNNSTHSEHMLLEGELSIGKNGVILNADPVAAKLLGYKEDSLIGTPLREILPALKQKKWHSFFDMISKLDKPDDFLFIALKRSI